MEITIPHNFTPRPYQVALYNCIPDGFRRGVAVWHRRAGKDKTLINIVARETQKRIGAYYYFFPSYKQGRKILWDGMDRAGFPFINHLPPDLISRKNDQEMKIYLKNGSLFQVVGTDDVDSIVGTNPVGCVFSEYALQKPEAWTFIRPILRENGGWALFNYTPRGLNHGHEIFVTAKSRSDWFCELLTVEDTKAIELSEIQKERDEGMSEAMVRQEYYCDFTASSDNVLIPLELVVKGMEKTVRPEDIRHAPRIFGVDVARFGDDTSVIARRQGLQLFDLIKFKNLDNMDFAARVANEIVQWGPDAVFIDAGRGEGVIDRLRQLGFDMIVEVNFGGKSGSERYINKRTEMWDGVAKWLKAGGSMPDDKDLRRELSLPTYDFDAANRMRLLSKEKIKEEYGFSPDCGDALALTFAEPVILPDDTRFSKQFTTAQSEYDLFSDDHAPVDTAVSEYDLFGGV